MDFFTKYFEYIGETECPQLFHRWCALAGVGAILGRNFHLHHGHFTVNPNLYTMLIGNPGTRKSTAIKLLKQLLVDAGYDKIAADKTTKEKFLLDISGESLEDATPESILDANLWGENDAEVASRPPAECFIMADEWNDFTSLGNLEFYSLLGTFWDYSGVYRNRIKNGKSVSINNPTVSILGGNTPTGFSLAFPPEALGQGFLSRLILVYGESTGKRIPFPKKPDEKLRAELVGALQKLRFTCQGSASLSPDAEKLLEAIYITHDGIEDFRFESYMNRRFTHLLKLCLINAATRLSKVIEAEDVVLANTVLTHTEHLMPKALGEFGKSKYSDTIHKLMEALSNTTIPLTFQDLWKIAVVDLEKQSILADILGNLKAADKIISVGTGMLAKKKQQKEQPDGLVDMSLLSLDEKGY